MVSAKAKTKDDSQVRGRRPSDKVAAQIEAQQEAAKLKAEKAERRALREKKALQKAKQQAGVETDSEDEFQQRPNPSFTSREVINKKTLAHRSSKVPPARERSPTREHSPARECPARERSPAQERSPAHERTHSLPQGSHIISDNDNQVQTHRRSKSPYRRSQSEQSSLPPIDPSHNASRSPSPQIGSKRQHTTDEENDSDVEEDDDHISKATKMVKKTARPKAGDFDEIGKELVLSAANTYRALLASQGAFPNSSTELKLIKKAWKLVNTESGVAPLNLSPSIVTIIKARGSQLRGEAKMKTAPLVEALYGFDSGRSKKAIAENRRIAEELKNDKGFVFSMLSDDNGKRKGIYNHPIIQKAVNKMWFKNKRDEGVLFSEYFNPLAVPSIALILTAIECNIEEWGTGIKTDITFWAEEYRPIFDSHVASLNDFGKYSKSKGFDLLGRLQRKLYNYGRLHAGISTIEPVNTKAIPFSAFVDAVEEYAVDDETDSEGDMRIA